DPNRYRTGTLLSFLSLRTFEDDFADTRGHLQRRQGVAQGVKKVQPAVTEILQFLHERTYVPLRQQGFHLPLKIDPFILDRFEKSATNGTVTVQQSDARCAFPLISFASDERTGDEDVHRGVGERDLLSMVESVVIVPDHRSVIAPPDQFVGDSADVIIIGRAGEGMRPIPHIAVADGEVNLALPLHPVRYDLLPPREAVQDETAEVHGLSGEDRGNFAVQYEIPEPRLVHVRRVVMSEVVLSP